MKKFFLRALLTSKELDIVNQEEIDLAITLPELNQITVLDCVNELIDEQLAGDIDHLHVFLLGPDVLANGLH